MNRASRRAARKGGPKGPAGGGFEIARREDLEHLCAFLASAKAPQLPLVRAAADLRINLAIIAFPELPWPGAALRRSARPTVVLIGDDVDGRPARLPRDWPCAQTARQWAATAIVHGTGGLPEHYREAVRAAEYEGRCLMIETVAAVAPAWVAFLRPRPTLAIVPTSGMHPIEPESVH